MNNNSFYISMFFMLVLLGCKKDVEINLPCQNTVNIGAVRLTENARNLISYPGGTKMNLFNPSREDSIELTINESFFRDDQFFWAHRSSDCETTNSDSEYLYSIEEKYAHIRIKHWGNLNTDFYSLVLMISSLFTEKQSSYQKTDESFTVLEFVSESQLLNDNPSISGLPFMDFTLSGNDLFDTYIHYPTIELNGKEFNDVYKSTKELIFGYEFINKLYINPEIGIIAIEDENGEAWTMD